MIDVEIKGRLGQFIKAQLLNVIDEGAVVIYPGRKEETIVPLNSVRLSPTRSKDVQPNQLAEVLFSISDTQPNDGNNIPGHSGDGRADRLDHQLLLDEQNDNLSIPSWWPCRVLKVRGDVVVVKLHVVSPSDASSADESLCNKLSAVTDIVNQTILRQPSGELPHLTPDMIHRHLIPIPKEMAEFASNPEVHADFLKHCGSQGTVYFDHDSSSLVVLSTDPSTVRNVPLLEDTHVKMLRQKWAITRSLMQKMRTLEANRAVDCGPQAIMTTSRGSGDWGSEPGSIVETFHVPQHLMGLAIGAHGANIKGAREIPGVLQVRVRENGGDVAGRRNGDSGQDCASDYGDSALFIVEAKTAEVAKQARAKLEYTELYIGVPRRCVGRLIGKRTSNIMSIIKKSRVIHIHFDDHIKGRSDDEDNLPVENFSVAGVGPVPASRRMRKIFLKVGGGQPNADEEEYGGFILVGTCESVEKARLLITFQLDYIWDLEKMEAEKVELLRSLSHTVGGESGAGGGRGGYPDGRWGDVAYRGGGGGGAGGGNAWNRGPLRGTGGGAAYRADTDTGADEALARGPANGTAGEMDRRQPRLSNQRPRRGRGGGGPPRNYGNWSNQQQHRQPLGTNNNGEVGHGLRGSRDSDGDANSVELAGGGVDHDHHVRRAPHHELSADERQFADGEGSDGPHQPVARSRVRGGGGGMRNTPRSENQFNAHEQPQPPNRTGHRPPRQHRSQQEGEYAAPHGNVPRTSGTEHASYLRQAMAQVSTN